LNSDRIDNSIFKVIAALGGLFGYSAAKIGTAALQLRPNSCW